MRKALLGIFFTILSTVAFAEYWLVEPGDSMSAIAARKCTGAIYGSKGSLARLLRLNPKVKDPNKIFPGLKIVLGNKSVKIQNQVKPPVAPQSKSDSDKSYSKKTIGDQVITSPKESIFIGLGEYEMGARLFFSTIKGFDGGSGTTGLIVSELGIGAHALMRQKWSNSNYTSQFFSVSREVYKPNVSALVTVQNRYLFLKSIGLGFERGFSSGNFIGANVSLSDEIFYRGLEGGGIVLEGVTVPKLKLSSTIHIFSSKKYTIAALASGDVYFPASSAFYRTNFGLAYHAGVRIKKITTRGVLTSGIFFSSQNINTNILQRKKSEFGLELLWNFM